MRIYVPLMFACMHANVLSNTIQVQEAVQTVLGRTVPPSVPLMSAGLDSLGAVEILRELNR